MFCILLIVAMFCVCVLLLSAFVFFLHFSLAYNLYHNFIEFLFYFCDFFCVRVCLCVCMLWALLLIVAIGELDLSFIQHMKSVPIVSIASTVSTVIFYVQALLSIRTTQLVFIAYTIWFETFIHTTSHFYHLCNTNRIFSMGEEKCDFLLKNGCCFYSYSTSNYIFRVKNVLVD